jgi:hypothetical protein
MINPHDFVLPRLTADETSFLPAEVLNGARLGAGQISACWTAKYTGSRDSSGGQATMTLQFTYASAAGTELVAFIQWSGFLSTCGITNFENSETDAINAARACPDSVESDFGNSTVKDVFDAHPADAVSGVNAKLAELQAGYYKDILSGGGSTLTSGTSIDTDVEAAARRLAGANAILNGYISLGLPQSLASDDNLRSLVSGANADAFARTSPSLNPWGVAYASDVPTQLVNFYKAALTAKPSLDPADEAADLVFLRSLALQQAIRPHIVPSAGTGQAKSIRLAAGITAQPSDATFAETNPFIGPTLDRVDETRAALADTLANGATLYTSVAGAGAGTVSDGSALSCSGTCSHNYTPGTSVTLIATPAAGSRFAGWSGACTGTGTCTVLLDYDQNVTAGFVPGPAPGAPTTSTTPTTTTPPASGHTHATAVRCTLKPNGNTVLLAKRHGRNHRHDPKPGTLTLTVRCDQAAAVRLTGRLTTLTGRARSHGKRRGQTTPLGPVRASVRAGAARSLTITIPTGALKALARHQRESVTFSLSATNANGASTATATVRTLAGIR